MTIGFPHDRPQMTPYPHVCHRQHTALGIEHCFVGFLPKPHVVIDDQELTVWKRFSVVHPMNTAGQSIEDYRELVAGD
jgi:hypothetical protein